MNGPRPDQILLYAKAALDGVVSQNNGKISIAKDAWHVLELLAESPSSFRCILHWAGDKNTSEVPELIFLTTRLEVILSCSLGLTANPERRLVEQSNVTNRPALLDLVSQIRVNLLQKLWPDVTTNQQIRYIGADPIGTPDGIPLAAYRLTFELDHLGPEFTNEPAAEFEQ